MRCKDGSRQVQRLVVKGDLDIPELVEKAPRIPMK